MKSYFAFSSLDITTLIKQRGNGEYGNDDLFLSAHLQWLVYFSFYFCPLAFGLLPHSHLILPQSSFLPLPCFVSLRFFHCHIVLLQMPHTFCQWSLCSGWKLRRPCIAPCQAAGDQGFLSFQLLLNWFLSLLQKRLAHGSNKFSMSFWPVFNRSASARTEMGSNLMLSAQPPLSLFTAAAGSPFAFLPLFPSLLLWFLSLPNLFTGHYPILARVSVGP